MITLSNLAVQFGGHFLFENVNIAIKPNDRIGLIGRNGNGKSTLLRLISGEQTPESGTISIPRSIKIGYLKQEIDNESDRSVWDEAYSALEEILSIEKRIDEITKEISSRTDYESDAYTKLIEELTNKSEMLAHTDASKAEKNIETILRGLGFKRKDFARPISEFSGGWQMRVELAKILLRKPDCLLMDEPTNHLDIESIIWLEGFLKDFSGNLLVVSHDRRFLDAVTNRTIEISRGHVYDTNLPYSKFVVYREEVRETQIAQRRNQEKQIAETERYIERFKAKARFASRAQSKAKMVEKIELIDVDEVDIKSMKFRFPEPPRSGRLVVETKDLQKSYGKTDVLKDIDFAMERGDRVAFVGKNGEGKTTLSKIIAGAEGYEGKLELGHNVSIGYFAQHQAELLRDDATVFEVIDNVATGELRSKVRTLLGAFLFSGDAVYKKVKVLSGGERARLALAKLMLEPVNFLIMDEPTNHLDMLAKDVLKQALMEYEGTLLVVSHDREFLEGLTSKTFEFRNRQIHEHLGDIKDFLKNRSVDDFFEYDSDKDLPEKSKASNTQSKSQPNRKDQKQNDRDRSKLEKELSKVESEIEELETDKKKYDSKFAEPEFYMSPDYQSSQDEYEKLTAKLNSANKRWEQLSEELIELE
jgi:ATP-binding cassette subfamily F protein 3